jgi:hypothetical protein
MGKPDYSWVWLDARFDSTQFKKIHQSEFVCKTYDRFTEAHPGYGSRRRNMTQNRNQVRKNLLFMMAKVDPMDGKAQTGFHNESRVGEVRVHARRQVKAN